MEEIEIVIAGKSFNMKIDSAKRELYRLAEQKLNASIIRLERMDYEGVGGKDIVSLAAFEFVVANVSLLQQSAAENRESDHVLREINQKMESYMNDLRNEKR